MVGPPERPLAVLVACSGLGHVARGFETFAHELHGVLLAAGVRSVLALGRGPVRGPGERLAPAVGRETAAARRLGRVTRRDGYWIEQMTYAAALLPLIARERPDLVVASDWALSRMLAQLRMRSGARFRLLLSNGAPGPPPYHPGIAHVQHLTPRTYGWALDAGEPAERHSVLPLGVAMPSAPARRAPDERARLRVRLGLPTERPVVLSVAALNLWSKRLDHLIDAVASLAPRPFLVLLGQPEEETPSVLALAERRLGPGGYTARTVAPAEVADFYRAADVFVLASLHESMGRVVVEAMSHGLPAVAHDSDVMRFVMGEHGVRGDLSQDRTLASLIQHALAEPLSEEAARRQSAAMRARFGWDALAPRWIELLTRVAG